MLDTQLKAQDDRNPVPSFLNTVNERIRMQQALNAGKERQDYYNQLKSGLYGKKGSQQPSQYNQGEGIGFNENGQYKIPAQQTFNPYGVDLSGLGGNEGNTISVSALNGVQNIQAPQQNSWGSLFNKSFNQPPTDNPQAQAVEGQGVSPNYMSLMSNGQITPQQQQAFDEKMNLRRWIEWDAQNNGVTNPLVSLQRYQMFMEPMRQQAELDELRNAYYTLHDPNASDIAKRNAATLISYTKGNPFMMEDHELLTDKTMYDMGMSRNSNYDVGNNILSVLGDYEEGEQWMSPDGTGTSRTQCSNWVSDVLRKAGIKGLGSANGDELMSQFGKAYHNGLDGIQPGDVLNFKDHVGIYAGNGQYVARNSSGGVHQGSMEEAIRYFGQPLGYGSIREFSGANTKYIRDPNNPNNFKGRAAADYKHHLKMKEIQARNEGNIRTALIKNQIKGSGSNKSSKNVSDLHESLNSLSDIEGKYDANADDATQKNYKKEYDKAYGSVKSSIQKEYPNLKQSVEQLKSKGYTTKQIGIMLAEDIYNNNNTKIGFEPLADIVSEIITSSNYGDPSYNSKELSAEIKQELGKTLERTKTLRNRSKRRPNSYDSIFGGYFNTSNAGLTDRDILDRQGSEKKDATRRILSEAERVGNIKYDDDKKFKEANKTEIERLYDEVEAHKKGKKK